MLPVSVRPLWISPPRTGPAGPERALWRQDTQWISHQRAAFRAETGAIGPTLDQSERLHRLTRVQVENQRSPRVHHGGHLEALQREAQLLCCHGNMLQILARRGGLSSTCAVRMIGWVPPAPGAAGRRNVPPAVCVRMRGGP